MRSVLCFSKENVKIFLISVLRFVLLVAKLVGVNVNVNYCF